MDFGGFVLFGLLVGGLLVAAAFRMRFTRRWSALGLWLCGLIALGLLGRHLYQVYWLDERLFIAASGGDAAD